MLLETPLLHPSEAFRSTDICPCARSNRHNVLYGIGDSNEVYERIKLGASLVQILSSMIYEGPTLISRMNNELAEKLKADGFKHINEAIGVAIQ